MRPRGAAPDHFGGSAAGHFILSLLGQMGQLGLVGLPDCVHGRALFSWYVFLLMALYVPAGWVVPRLRD